MSSACTKFAPETRGSREARPPTSGSFWARAFPVPPGFVVRAAAYVEFLERLDMEAALREVGDAPRSELPQRCSSVRSRIEATEMLPELFEEIRVSRTASALKPKTRSSEREAEPDRPAHACRRRFQGCGRRALWVRRTAPRQERRCARPFLEEGSCGASGRLLGGSLEPPERKLAPAEVGREPVQSEHQQQACQDQTRTARHHISRPCGGPCPYLIGARRPRGASLPASRLIASGAASS